MLIGGEGKNGELVSLTISPPSGDAYALPQVTTDIDGKFTTSWVVPSDAVDGLHTLTVSAMGVMGETTFTLYNR